MHTAPCRAERRGEWISDEQLSLGSRPGRLGFGLGVGFGKGKSRLAGLDWQLHRPRHCPPSLEIARPLALKVKSQRARVRYGRIDADLMLKSSGTLQREVADSNKSSMAHHPYTLPVLLLRRRHLACHAYTAAAFIRASHVLCSPILSQIHCTDCASGSVQADWPVAHAHCQA